MNKRKLGSFALSAMLFALCQSAEAQRFSLPCRPARGSRGSRDRNRCARRCGELKARTVAVHADEAPAALLHDQQSGQDLFSDGLLIGC